MLLRYWGVADVQAEDFAPLVDRTAGGISTVALSQALAARGLAPRSVRAVPAQVAREVARGRPVIALIDGGGGRLHYVVIVAWARGQVLFHDPAIGPFRLLAESAFEGLWKATDGFALFVSPASPLPQSDAGLKGEAPPTPSPPATGGGPCDALIDPAIETARSDDPEAAVAPLAAAVDLCPTEARALAALAGVRFRQERWGDSADFARRALSREGTDPEMWRLLGANLYLADRPREALAAWNRIEEPRIDRIEIDGLLRTRQDLATSILGLKGRDVLTLEALTLAERRLASMPTATGVRVSYRPLTGGKADVVATLGEARLTEPWLFLAARLVTKGAVRREMSVRLNGVAHRGESLQVGVRFESHRPSFWATIEAPRLGGWPGVVSLSALWDRQTYRPDPAGSTVSSVETRRRGAAAWSHWVRPNLRLEVGLAADRFEAKGDFASIRTSAELRFFADRAALLAGAESWKGVGDAEAFAEGGATVALRARPAPGRFQLNLRLDGRRASRRAPLAVWPGAGTGPGRPLLLRALPLVESGELIGEGFGRGLLHATVEGELKVAQRGPARLGLAAFGDWARAWERMPPRGGGENLFSVGLGLRLRGFGDSTFRVDVAMRPGSRDVVLSGGVIPPWPR